MSAPSSSPTTTTDCGTLRVRCREKKCRKLSSSRSARCARRPGRCASSQHRAAAHAPCTYDTRRARETVARAPRTRRTQGRRGGGRVLKARRAGHAEGRAEGHAVQDDTTLPPPSPFPHRHACLHSAAHTAPPPPSGGRSGRSSAAHSHGLSRGGEGRHLRSARHARPRHRSARSTHPVAHTVRAGRACGSRAGSVTG